MPYLIDGPESLLKAAQTEIQAVLLKESRHGGPKIPGIILDASAALYWVTGAPDPKDSYWSHLTLPADWDKLMGILADLKKPKLPEYVRFQYRYSARVGKVCDTDPSVANTSICTLFDVRGQKMDVPAAICTAITEQEFIDGGLKELAEAGYVKGAKVGHGAGVGVHCTISSLLYQQRQAQDGYASLSTNKEVAEKGFCFRMINSGNGALPVGQCALVPALPTTSQDIPYVAQPDAVYIGYLPQQVLMRKSILRHLLKQGVTELVTKAGRLTQADLELLAK